MQQLLLGWKPLGPRIRLHNLIYYGHPQDKSNPHSIRLTEGYCSCPQECAD